MRQTSLIFLSVLTFLSCQDSNHSISKNQEIFSITDTLEVNKNFELPPKLISDNNIRKIIIQNSITDDHCFVKTYEFNKLGFPTKHYSVMPATYIEYFYNNDSILKEILDRNFLNTNSPI